MVVVRGSKFRDVNDSYFVNLREFTEGEISHLGQSRNVMPWREKIELSKTRRTTRVVKIKE
jgi:hypothetical protein